VSEVGRGCFSGGSGRGGGKKRYLEGALEQTWRFEAGMSLWIDEDERLHV